MPGRIRGPIGSDTIVPANHRSGKGGSMRREKPVNPTSRGRYGCMARAGRVAFVAASATTVLVFPTGGASAHEERRVEDLTFVVGWSGEPAYAAFGNEVQVIVERNGRPVEDGELEAEVIFGDPEGETRTTVTLDPAFGTPNEYLGYLIPTRPGTYSFHITGTVGGHDIDEVFTSGEETFDDVNNPTEAEFPEQDPTRGELAEAVDRLTGRIDELRAEPASTDERGDPVAMWIGIGSGVVALIALVVAMRRRSVA
jgi:hypothetical protein